MNGLQRSFLTVLLLAFASFCSSDVSAADCSSHWRSYQYYYQLYNQYRNSGLQSQRNAAPQILAIANSYLARYNACARNSGNGGNGNGGNNGGSNGGAGSNSNFQKQLLDNAMKSRAWALNALNQVRARNGYVLTYWKPPAYPGQSYMGPYTYTVSKAQAVREINRLTNNLNYINGIRGF